MLSTVINNGHFTEFFNLQCGCRQGDPLSPYLFLLAVEPLAAALKTEKKIKGIKLGTKEYKLGQYADDMFMTLDGTQEGLETVFWVLQRFEKCSGLKVNVEKSHGIWIGSKINSADTVSNRIRLKWTKEFTLLGIDFNTDIARMCDVNYIKAIGKIENVLKIHLYRNISLSGRITVLKTLVLPILTHVLQVLPRPSLKI